MQSGQSSKKSKIRELDKNIHKLSVD